VNWPELLPHDGGPGGLAAVIIIFLIIEAALSHPQLALRAAIAFKATFARIITASTSPWAHGIIHAATIFARPAMGIHYWTMSTLQWLLPCPLSSAHCPCTPIYYYDY